MENETTLEDLFNMLQQDEEVVAFGLRPVPDNADCANFVFYENMEDRLSNALQKACLQNPAVYEKVRSLFIKLGKLIEPVEKELKMRQKQNSKLN